MTKAAKDAFLEQLAGGLSVSHAAEIAGHDRGTFYRLKDRDPVFRHGWADALEEGNDAIREEIRRRGVEGVEEPVYYQGKVVGQIRRYSDTLLLAMANSRLTEFREVYARSRQPETPAIPEVTHGLDISKLTDTELDQLRELVAKARRSEIAAVA